MHALNLNAEQEAKSMNQYKSNLEESLKTIENSNSIEDDLNKEVNRGSNRYTYFQELAQYVNDLGEFLDAKVSICTEMHYYKYNTNANKQ
jgi:GC-rich sequence DNA-binding factor